MCGSAISTVKGILQLITFLSNNFETLIENKQMKQEIKLLTSPSNLAYSRNGLAGSVGWFCIISLNSE